MTPMPRCAVTVTTTTETWATIDCQVLYGEYQRWRAWTGSAGMRRDRGGAHLLAAPAWGPRGSERSAAAERLRRDVSARPLPADSLARARTAEDGCEDGPRMLNPPLSHWTTHSHVYT
ncbi:unnamed protein product [Spodoptera exigua]|nr:unnamed protein product [Spodoptera exigua]